MNMSYNNYLPYTEITELSYLVKKFQEVNEYFEGVNYPPNKTSLMCSIHNTFKIEEGHNCVACNLEKSSKLIAHNLRSYLHFQTTEMVFPNFIFPIYLMVERMEEYLNIMELQRSIREKNFKVFSLIKQWANFTKHPKAFMLVHHPTFIFEDFELPENHPDYKKKSEYEIVIDNDFVKEYYSGGSNNKKLYDKLIRKEDVLVMYPDPLKLIQDFCKAQTYFVSLICENKVFQDLLSEKATKYYENEDAKIISNN